MDRYRNPRWKGLGLACGRAASGSDGAGNVSVPFAHGDNPLCGDALDMEVLVRGAGDDAVIEAVRFDGYGCSLCLATADLVADRMQGARVADALRWGFEDALEAWGGLEVGRSRAACVRLPVDVLHEALGRRISRGGE